MKANEKGYKPLPQRDDELPGLAQPHVSRHLYYPLFFVSGLCMVLLVSNILLLSQRAQTPTLAERTRYAGLTRDVPVAWSRQGIFNSENETLTDLAWNDLSIDTGTVALTDEYSESMGLPRSQRFPWDDTKGIYLLNAFHNLHCLKMLYRSITETRNGLAQSSPIGHSIHCLNALRQDVICNADDTPRYTGFQPHKSSGLGQFRQCKDWSRLEAWAEERTACYRYINNTDPDFDTLERYKFCPKDSPYQGWIHEIFGDFET